MTNVAGPQEPMHFAGAPVRGAVVWAPCAGEVGISVSIFSYAGEVRLGLAVDAGLVPEPQEIVDAFEVEYRELAAPTRPSTPLPHLPSLAGGHVHRAAFAIGTGDMSTTGYGSITLPSLIVATYGGGTGLATQRECLELLGCYGKGGVRKFAEIVAATVLCGELSLGAAIVAEESARAHDLHGRNRP